MSEGARDGAMAAAAASFRLASLLFLLPFCQLYYMLTVVAEGERLCHLAASGLTLFGGLCTEIQCVTCSGDHLRPQPCMRFEFRLVVARDRDL